MAYDGSAQSENPLREETTIRLPLMTLDVRLARRFGVQAALTVPAITRTAVVPRAAGPLNYRETFRGIGDTSVVAWYQPRTASGWNVVVNAGASIPTGKTEAPRFREELDEGSLVPVSRLQRGSGTIDPLFGVTVSRRLAGATTFGSFAARTPLVENEHGLRTGTSWEASGGAARELGHRVAAFARLSWLRREQDVFGGTPVLVGGGNWLYVTPGAALQVGKGITVQAEVKLPLHRNLANRQLDSAAIFQFGLSRSF